MTTRIGFYHLTKSTLEQALPKLLDRALKAGHKTLLIAGSAERIEHLDALLWTFEADSWLPHGAVRGGDAALQPILLTVDDENLNQADVLVLTDGVSSTKVDQFSRCINLFDGNDAEAVQAARRQWKDWAAQGLALTYFQQSERGGWQEKASANVVNDKESDDVRG
jgi:DNA polymerase-3 subunit chi